MPKLLTPHALKNCPICSGTGGVSGEPCACRFEEPSTSFWARMGQREGWTTSRSREALVFVGGQS